MEKVNAQWACMAGTNQPDPRCLGLQGSVGEDVRCTVYASRPEPCRQVQQGDDRCLEARRSYAMPPLPTPPLT